MKILKNAVLLAIILLLLACEKEVTNIDLSGYGSQLVINSFISPQDTLLRVFVHESIPVTGARSESAFDALTDATVTLSDGQRTILLSLATIFTFSKGDVYQVRAEEFPIEAGRTYYLEVRTPDGRFAKAQCTVPLATTSPELALDSADTSENGSRVKQYTWKLRWPDPAGEQNYYRVAGEFIYQRLNNGYPPSEERAPLNLGSERASFFKDTRLDGTVFTSPEGTFSLDEGISSATLYVSLLMTDRSYFEYHRTFLASEVDNPFAEPVFIYSNVEGGLGVFAAFNQTTREVKLR